MSHEGDIKVILEQHAQNALHLARQMTQATGEHEDEVLDLVLAASKKLAMILFRHVEENAPQLQSGQQAYVHVIVTAALFQAVAHAFAENIGMDQDNEDPAQAVSDLMRELGLE